MNIFNLKQSQVDISQKRKFRASVYVDIFVPETDSIENDRQEAEKVINEIASTIPNSYVGGVALATGNLLEPFDKEF